MMYHASRYAVSTVAGCVGLQLCRTMSKNMTARKDYTNANSY